MLGGVVAVFTGEDLKADGVKPLPPDFAMHGTVEMMKALPDVILVNSKSVPHLEYDLPYPAAGTGQSALRGRIGGRGAGRYAVSCARCC